MNKYINIDGGIGRVICAIPALEEYCKQHPDTIVQTSWSDVLMHNPYIKNIQAPNESPWTLWKDKIQHMEYLHPEPYHFAPYYQNKVHLRDAFHQLINGVQPSVATSTQHYIHLSPEEKQLAQQLKANITASRKANKIVMMQGFGSTATFDGTVVSDASGRSLNNFQVGTILDNLPEDVVVIWRGNIGFNHPRVISLDMSLRMTFVALSICDEVITIDSCLLHMAVAMGKSGVALWGTTSQNNLAYPQFKNMQREGFPKAYLPFRIADFGHFPNELLQGAMGYLDEELKEVSKYIARDLDKKRKSNVYYNMKHTMPLDIKLGSN